MSEMHRREFRALLGAAAIVPRLDTTGITPGYARVDVKGCVTALKDIGFEGWAIVERDRVVDQGGTPKASAEANRAFVVNQLGLTP